MFLKIKTFFAWSVLLSVSPTALQQKGRQVFEKYLYETSSNSDGTLWREHKLRSITTYDKGGKIIKHLLFSDFISCNIYSEVNNRPKTSFSSWYDYKYDSNQLVQLTYRECDSLVFRRQFISYSFNQQKQPNEKGELFYDFKRHNNELEEMDIRDSVLTAIITIIYKYDVRGNILQETTMKAGYEYGVIYNEYNKEGKLQKTKSNLSDAIEIKEFEYESDQLIRTKISRDGSNGEINYSYNARGLLILEVLKIPKHKDLTFRYFYNEEDRLIRIEEFNGFDSNIDEFEYTYYE